MKEVLQCQNYARSSNGNRTIVLHAISPVRQQTIIIVSNCHDPPNDATKFNYDEWHMPSFGRIFYIFWQVFCLRDCQVLDLVAVQVLTLTAGGKRHSRVRCRHILAFGWI